jgi:hypothetical protein
LSKYTLPDVELEMETKIPLDVKAIPYGVPSSTPDNVLFTPATVTLYITFVEASAIYRVFIESIQIAPGLEIIPGVRMSRAWKDGGIVGYIDG